jgi:hypothetical protein
VCVVWYGCVERGDSPNLNQHHSYPRYDLRRNTAVTSHGSTWLLCCCLVATQTKSRGELEKVFACIHTIPTPEHKRRISFMKSTMAERPQTFIAQSFLLQMAFGRKTDCNFFSGIIVPRCQLQEACSSCHQGDPRLCRAGYGKFEQDSSGVTPLFSPVRRHG